MTSQEPPAASVGEALADNHDLDDNVAQSVRFLRLDPENLHHRAKARIAVQQAMVAIQEYRNETPAASTPAQQDRALGVIENASNEILAALDDLGATGLFWLRSKYVEENGRHFDALPQMLEHLQKAVASLRRWQGKEEELAAESERRRQEKQEELATESEDQDGQKEAKVTERQLREEDLVGKLVEIFERFYQGAQTGRSSTKQEDIKDFVDYWLRKAGVTKAKETLYRHYILPAYKRNQED